MAVQLEGTASTQSNAASTTHQAPKPAGLATGERIFVFIKTASSAGALTDQLGFTLHLDADTAGASHWFLLSKQVANAGSEPAAYDFVSDTSAASIAASWRVSGHDSTTPVNQVATITDNGTATGSVTINGVTTTVDGCLLVWLASTQLNVTATWGEPPSEFFDAAGGTNRSVHGAHETQTTQGATGTETATFSGSAINTGAVIAIAPTSELPPDPGAGAVQTHIVRTNVAA